MKIYLLRARRNARDGQALPYQLEYILDEPGDSPAKKMESAAIVWRFLFRKQRCNNWASNDDTALKLGEIGYQVGVFGSVHRQYRNQYADDVINSLKVLVEEYAKYFDQRVEAHLRYVRERREYIDKLDEIRSEDNPGSRSLRYDDPI